MEWLLSMAEAAATAAPDPGFLKVLETLTWPGAAVGVAFSPLGKAVAAWIQSRTPAPPSAQSRASDLPKEVTDALKDITGTLKRTTDIQTKQMEILLELERSVAILMDRTPRQNQIAG